MTLGAHLNTANERHRLELILVLLLILLLVFSLYSSLKIRGLESQVASLQNENDNQAQRLSSLQNELTALNSEIQSVLYPTRSTTNFELTGACVSIMPNCGGYVYLITLDNNGTTSIPIGYSVSLSFKDTTKLTFFGFNTTLPQGLPANSATILSATSWPSQSNATSKMSPGDNMSVAVEIGSSETFLETHVQYCTSYTTTLENTTEAQTMTTQTCN